MSSWSVVSELMGKASLERVLEVSGQADSTWSLSNFGRRQDQHVRAKTKTDEFIRDHYDFDPTRCTSWLADMRTETSCRRREYHVRALKKRDVTDGGLNVPLEIRLTMVLYSELRLSSPVVGVGKSMFGHNSVSLKRMTF